MTGYYSQITVNRIFICALVAVAVCTSHGKCEANTDGESDSLSARAEKAFEHEEYETAISLLTEALKGKPNPEFLCERAAAKSELRDYAGAIRDCDDALKLHPNEHALIMAYLCRAQCFVATNDHNHAISDCTLALDIDAKCMEAWIIRAGVWYQLENAKLAIVDINHCIDLDPTRPEAYGFRSACHQTLGDWTNAVADADKAVQLDDKNSNCYMFRGSAHAGNLEFDKSLADFDKALSLDPGNDAAVAAQCVILATCPKPDLRDTTRALQLAQRLCEQKGMTDCNRLSLLASVYAETGDFKNAVEWQEQAIKAATADQKNVASERLKRFQSGRTALGDGNTYLGLTTLKSWR